MKKQFRIEHLGRSFKERLGLWSGEKNNVATPAVWITSQGGAIPNLTPETIQYLTTNAQFAGILVPFQYHTRDVEVLEKFKKGIDVFMGLPPNQWNILVVPQDPGIENRQGYHTNKDISLWDCTGNRVPVDFNLYNRGVHAMRPDAYVSLCDGETPKNCPKKRIAKATAKSLKFLDQHLAHTCEISDNDDAPKLCAVKESFIFGAIEGGYDIETRKYSAKELSERPVDGFFLDGFNLTTEESINLDYDKNLKEVINDSVIPILPEDKIRVYLGICTPSTILKLVEAGVDMFDSSYARYATDQGKALVFTNTLGSATKNSNVILNESLITKTNDHSAEKHSESNAPCSNNSDLIDLNDGRFKNDFRPILSTCLCYTCRKHTRAYINHLLITKEMLGQVLLTIHNLHHYATFFETLRQSIRNDTYQELKNLFV
jgi:queuine tRNA-ribosyltransferase subunit QTRTD1